MDLIDKLKQIKENITADKEKLVKYKLQEEQLVQRLKDEYDLLPEEVEGKLLELNDEVVKLRGEATKLEQEIEKKLQEIE